MQFFIDQSGLTYEQVTAITQNTWFIIFSASIWITFLLLWIITGILVHAKSSNGRSYSKPMIFYPNFWFAVVYWMICVSLWVSFVIFPLWLK